MRVGRQRRESDVVVNIVGGEVLFFFFFFFKCITTGAFKILTCDVCLL